MKTRQEIYLKILQNNSHPLNYQKIAFNMPIIIIIFIFDNNHKKAYNFCGYNPCLQLFLG